MNALIDTNVVAEAMEAELDKRLGIDARKIAVLEFRVAVGRTTMFNASRHAKLSRALEALRSGGDAAEREWAFEYLREQLGV